MKKFVILLMSLLLTACSHRPAEKEIEIQGKLFKSKRPPFTLSLPLEFEFIHSSSLDYPKENSLTRTYLYATTKENRVEEILVVQIADRTNPQAEPITAPPLKSEKEKRVFSTGQTKKENVEVNYLIQLIAWNPDAPSLQPLRRKGMVIPSHWALQGQLLFIYYGDHAVLIRSSKDVNAFGLKVSDAGNKWGKESISGSEKKAFDIFQKSFMEMIGSIQIKRP